MALTPGMQSSEFYKCLVPVLAGVGFIVAGALGKGPPDSISLGITLLLGGTGIYGVSRGMAKFGSAGRVADKAPGGPPALVLPLEPPK